MNRAHVADVVYVISQGEGGCVLMWVCVYPCNFKSVVYLEAYKVFQSPSDTWQIFRELNQSCEGNFNSVHFDYSGTSIVVVVGLCHCDKDNCQTCFVSVCLSFPCHPIFDPFILPFVFTLESCKMHPNLFSFLLFLWLTR